MRIKPIQLTLALAAGFAAGLVASPRLSDVLPRRSCPGGAAGAGDDRPGAVQHAELPTTASPEMNAETLVTTDNATIGVQSSSVAKHLHPKTDEIQVILEGSGAMWLGGERKDFKPGTLIVIPKGTAHGGTIVSSGPVKAIAIKIPPQPRDDVTFLQQRLRALLG